MEQVVNLFFNIVFFNVFELFGLGDKVDLPFSIAVLLIGYIYVMFKLHFIQFTHFGVILRYTFARNKKEKNTSSPLKTLLTSMASCTGMNATAGVVFMIAIGGVGTVFWLLILALSAMPFRFSEGYLSHFYRSTNQNSNSMIGGPFDYIKKGLADIGFRKMGKTLSLVYAGLMVLSGVVGVSMYEMNQAVVVFEKGFAVLEGKRMMLSVFFTILASWVVLGGTKRIERFMSIVLPVLSITYVFVSIIVIACNFDKIGSVMSLIYEDAMRPKSLAGGIIASFCLCARKFTLAHETGLGTSGIVHASSVESDSVKEATRAMLTPVTTVIICLSTSLVLLTTNVYQDAEIMKDGVSAISYAFGLVFKPFSYIVVAIIPMFTINVMIGWSNYVAKCTTFIFKRKQLIAFVMALFFVFAFIGGIIDNFYFIMNVVDTILMFILLLNVPIIAVLTNKIVQNVVKKYNFK